MTQSSNKRDSLASAGDDAERFIKGTQHAVELLAAADDQTGRRDQAIGALPPCEPRVLLDTVERDLAGAAKDREDRTVLQEIDGIVAPFAGRDLAAIETEQAAQLGTVERDLCRGDMARSDLA